MPSKTAGERRRIPTDTYFFFFGVFTLLGFLTHAPFLRLPFFWDELGQFVPAALALLRNGSWIPHGTAEAYPPGLAAFLAGTWSITGYSIEATRAAMLVLGAAVALAAFLLAIELSREAQGAPAFAAVGFLCISPLFYAQSMLAQPELPAALFTSLALLFFFQDNVRRAAAACLLLVLFQPGGVVTPLVLGFWLCRERRWREALSFAVPLAVLALWLAAVARSGGLHLVHPGGPAHMLFALARRIYFLGFENFHWIGILAIGLAWQRRPWFRTRPWRVAALLVGAHLVAAAFSGGAVLERNLLPVMPVLFAAMAVGMQVYPGRLRLGMQAALIAGLLVGIFWNPPYPFAYDENLAFTDFVALQRRAADYLERWYPQGPVTTAWPLSAALADPDMGYVTHKMEVRELSDFRPRKIDWERTRVFVLYSRTWVPEWGLLNVGPLRAVWSRIHGHQPVLSGKDIPLKLAARWSRRGQWVEVYAAASGLPTSP